MLINPNTSVSTTAAMVGIAKDSCPPTVEISAMTAPFGAPLICDMAQLATSADAVFEGFAGVDAADDLIGIIVAAFGDPAVERLRQTQSLPVVGLAEASMRAAAVGHRRFSIVTTTPGLEDAIRRRAQDTGCADQLASIRYTASSAQTLAAEPGRLQFELREATQAAVALDGAEAVVIGGGPLAVAARDLRKVLDVPIIEPLPAAVDLVLNLGSWK